MTSRNILPIRAASALALGIAALGGLAAPAILNAQPVGSVRAAPVVLSVGGSQVVNLSGPMSDVVIADPSVVDVHVRAQNQLYLIAKKAGETSISVTAANGRVLYSSLVQVGNNITSIDQMLGLTMPDARVQVATMNGMVLLTGTVKAPEDAAEAERLTQAFVGKDVTVVSRLRTATPMQVSLRVRISEVNRSLLHTIGTNFKSFDPGGTNNIGGIVGRANRDIGTFNTDRASPGYRGFQFSFPTDGSTNIGLLSHIAGVDIAGALDLAENTGLATSLADTNLASLSGETASFLAGGEYPYQVSNGTQGNSIEFKQYGVQLAFTPTVLSDGRVSLRVRPAVSTLDFSINAQVPALKTRTAETTVELGSGQAFMIAGLLSNDSANNIGKIPGIGNVPILGSLFKSRKFQRNETELVIVVTPYLVKPINANDVVLPTDGFRTATEAQGLLLQQGADGKSGQKGNAPIYVPPAASGAPAPQAPAGKRRADNKAGKGAAPGFSF